MADVLTRDELSHSRLPGCRWRMVEGRRVFQRQSYPLCVLAPLIIWRELDTGSAETSTIMVSVHHIHMCEEPLTCSLPMFSLRMSEILVMRFVDLFRKITNQGTDISSIYSVPTYLSSRLVDLN